MDKTFDAVMTDLRAGQFAPLYMLCGDESYYIDQVSDFIEAHALPESEQTFNQTVLYGKDVKFEDLALDARRVPMMSERIVIIVREAQVCRKDAWGAFLSYAQRPEPTSIIVFCYKYGRPDLRDKTFKAIREHGVFMESKRLYDYQVPKWVEQYVTHEMKLKVSPEAATLITEYLGNDLSLIHSELQKLPTAVPNLTTITPDIVRAIIGRNKAYTEFELCDAILARDAAKAFLIVRHFEGDPKTYPIQKTLPILFYAFSELLQCYYEPVSASSGNNFQRRRYQKAMPLFRAKTVSDILHLIRTCDAQSKGFECRTPDGLLHQLVGQILAAR